MRGNHARSPTQWWRGVQTVTIGGELAVLAFIAVVTYLAAIMVWTPWAGLWWDLPDVYERRLLVVAGALVPALIRRRLPTPALLASAVLFGWYPASGAALAVTSYGAATRIRSVRRRVGALVLAAVVPLAIGMVESRFQIMSTTTVYGLGALACVVVPALMRVLLGQRERLVGALREQTCYLEQNYQLADSAARLQERSRIAEEMHDLLGHRLSLISLYAGALELDAAAGSPDVADEVKLIRGTVGVAMDELRTMLGVLRQPGQAGTGVRPGDESGTRADITELVEQSRAAGVQVDLDWSGADLVGAAPAVRRAVHRVVREALTNVHRHAATAPARVAVSCRADGVSVDVTNGPAQRRATAGGLPGTGRGLVGVQERVRLLGGTFTGGPLPDGGFRLAVQLPLDLVGRSEPIDGTAVNGTRINGSPRSASAAAGAPDSRPTRAENQSDPPAAGSDRWARVGMATVLATGLLGAVAFVIITFNTMHFDDPADTVTKFEDVRLGTPRSQVMKGLDHDNPRARLAARTVENPPPSRDCWYGFFFNDRPDDPGRIVRYCFRDERLVDKARFQVPSNGA